MGCAALVSSIGHDPGAKRKQLDVELHLGESAADQTVDPGVALKLFKGTPFAEALARGDIAVVSSAYFEQCWAKGECIADRANIPESEWVMHEGYLIDAEDLLVETLTIKEAKRKAVNLPSCQGFCWCGPVTDNPVEIFFKGRVKRDPYEEFFGSNRKKELGELVMMETWTSFKRERYFFEGEELMDLWQEYGYFFLVVVSYGWLAKHHPDPNMFHLKRLVRILKEWKSRAAMKRNSGYGIGYTGEIGVILDFCSLWQGERSPEQEESFTRGLKQINAPYCHRNVGAIKMMAVPAEEPRKYDDRGWTFFESCVIDGKEASDKDGFGRLNIITVDDDFDPDGEMSRGFSFIEQFAFRKRMPIRTPEDFEMQLKERGRRAMDKGVNLFTSGSDQPFILKKYASCFKELAAAENLDYGNSKWGDAEILELSKLLKGYTSLQRLNLANGNITDISSLAEALKGNTSLRLLSLFGNQIADISLLAESLKGNSSLQELRLDGNRLQIVSPLAESLQGNTSLRMLDLSFNQISASSQQELREALKHSTQLEIRF